MKRFAILILLLLIAAGGVVAYRGAAVASKQVAVEPLAPINVDVQRAAEHLSRAVQFKTISFEAPSPISQSEFLAFHRWIEETYPKTHAALKREVLRGFSLLYQWTGSDLSLKPLQEDAFRRQGGRPVLPPSSRAAPVHHRMSPNPGQRPTPAP